MKKFFILLGVILAIAFGSCTKKAADMIVGRWAVEGERPFEEEMEGGPFEFLEFSSDGTMKMWRYGLLFEGSYQVEGPNICLSFSEDIGMDHGNRNICGLISDLHPHWVWLTFDDHSQFYGERNTPFPICTWTNAGATISVTGDTWYVLDHQYKEKESIHLENVTFGLYNAVDWDLGQSQTLLGCCKYGMGVTITQTAECPRLFGAYSNVRFTKNDDIKFGYEAFSGNSTANGYILYNSDVVFSQDGIWLNGEQVVYYYSSPDLSSLYERCYCLFAIDEHGNNVVQNQTASLGTITFTDEKGNVSAKYIPMLDDNGTPCFYNSVSGVTIYPSGSGMPIFHEGN